MRAADLPPGHRRFVLDRRGVQPGDVLRERGPRIGERFWLVVHVEPATKHDHAAVRQINLDEVDGEISWHLR